MNWGLLSFCLKLKYYQNGHKDWRSFNNRQQTIQIGSPFRLIFPLSLKLKKNHMNKYNIQFLKKVLCVFYLDA